MHTIIAFILKIVGLAIDLFQQLFARRVGWITIDRKSGKITREQQPLLKKLKLLVLFNPITEWVDRTHLLRLWTHERSLRAGAVETRPESHEEIKSFIKFYNINMAHFHPSDPEAYSTFGDFFIRKHAPGARPIYKKDDPSMATIVSDSRVVVYPTVEATRKLWIKGDKFTIANLIQDPFRAKSWVDGAVASFRLSPQDYHRYHSPVEGTVRWIKVIPGVYYQVDPVALQSSVNVLTENARCCLGIKSEEFGMVLFVAIGATDVGTVEIHDHVTAGYHIKKGEEVGLFQYGGSSIIVAFEKGHIQFDEDLERSSHQKIMVNVEVGQSMGRSMKSLE
ncbi:phosphatidylserine decarboxylase-domain-containing protein [Aspergillus avenaceus]|uniref:Phosphatidylserine decarboxylase-domain-containing protein n=1 Tax=Aspergillus avenaceus TaxID=36643 RepID=A0A5N6U901_ASPAV|nr:phosphatidylserine decarboxylase-domain-containing protein [Aspergillus avenaceus]